MDNNKDFYNNLIKLSELFKEGFTLSVKNGVFYQYCSCKRPYVVSIRPIIKISVNDSNQKVFDYWPISDKTLKHCIIGGFYDIKDNIYLIELNKAFKYKRDALKAARLLNQKYVYDITRGQCINV